jgi:hypothetical protein
MLSIDGGSKYYWFPFENTTPLGCMLTTPIPVCLFKEESNYNVLSKDYYTLLCIRLYKVYIRAYIKSDT